MLPSRNYFGVGFNMIGSNSFIAGRHDTTCCWILLWLLLLLLLLLLRLRQHGTGSFSTISAAAIRKNLLLVACISISTSSITRASGNSIAEFGLKVAVVQVSIRHHGLQIIRRATQLSPPCMVNTTPFNNRWMMMAVVLLSRGAGEPFLSSRLSSFIPDFLLSYSKFKNVHSTPSF
jgi:hypothetical protein